VDKGRFITIEGLDGAGTTTQAEMLKGAIEGLGRKVVLTGEPTCGPVGSLIRQILQSRITGGTGRPFSREALALLFAADRLDHCEVLIRPSVEQGIVVISDRYVHSSLAYQTMDAPLQWVETINRFALKPDLVIFLEISPETAMERVRNRGSRLEIFEFSELQRRIRVNYEQALEQVPSDKLLVVDGELPIQEIHRQILNTVTSKFDWKRS